jgi:DNA polymerase I-like protein with 3'-5' exonuclease and polymerase domains
MKWVAEQGAPMAKFFREYGDLDKKRGTDLERLIQGVDSNSRYHTSIWQCGTKTGRFSSDFQQVPRDAMFFCPQCGGFTLGFVIKDEAGVAWYQCSCHNKQDVPHLLQLLSYIDIRRLVVPREGHQLVVCDYNQLELRLIGHFSRDPILTSAYRNGLDLHKITGENLNIPRQDAKPVNFGLAYGLTRNSLVELFGEEKADEVYPLLRERYKVLMKYTTSVHQAARETGFTRTIAGRKRRVPLINTGDRYERGHAERQAFNSKMQGSAADLVKMAQRDLAAKVPEFKQILQVHDEVVGEVRGSVKQAQEVSREVKKVMESYSRYLEVPLLCEPEVCPNWRAGKG